jgi:NADH dehydrogenase
LLADGVEVVVADVRDATATTAAAAGVDIVVSAVHGFAGPGRVTPASVDRDGNLNLISATRSANAEFILMSMVGASPDSGMELFRMKYAAEQGLAGSGIPATVVRATAFAELWIELLRSTASRSNRPVVFGRGQNPINFVSVRDVAALVETAVLDDTTRGQTLEIGGPANLTFDDLAQVALSQDGRLVNTRHVPRAMLRVMAMTIGRVHPELGRQARAALVMDEADMTFDGQGARARFRELPSTTVQEIAG